ncbi:MAG TPA: hypothetical protein VFN09_12950 [Rhodanobacteraceae bacterium]|nr:hypothetical protein [Rhodanobacteraceae bacterium]
MDELLQKALAGVDPGAPGAFWQIFANLMRLVPWWQLAAFNLACVLVAAWLAKLRGGNLKSAIAWSLLLGPLAWPLVWLRGQPVAPCPRCATPVPSGRERCPHCGCHQGARRSTT